MNEKLKSISRQAADVLTTKLDDSEEKLLLAIHEHITAHKDDDKCPPFSVSFAIKLDWDANKVVHVLSFTQKYKDETCEDIPDANQLRFKALEEEDRDIDTDLARHRALSGDVNSALDSALGRMHDGIEQLKREKAAT